jgi:hypothetical protein
MKKSQVLSLLGAMCAVILLTTASTVYGQGSVTLIGTVNGQDNKAKAGARVEFSPNGYVAVTDRNGRFIVRDFLPGWYTVTVREGGKYQIFRQNIQGTIDLEINW